MSDRTEQFAASGALRGTITVPGDKSITHRSVLFGGFAAGTTNVTTSMIGRDNLASVRVMQKLGVDIRASLNDVAFECAQTEDLQNVSRSEDELCRLQITGKGFAGLQQPDGELYCGNSGTTARPLTGIVAGCPFPVTLTGDESLSRRPMKRVVDPLSQMGATFDGDRFPLTCYGSGESPLGALSYESPRASAQVKSAILLAGLQSEEPVSVIEPMCSRDHTERMLSAMGVSVSGSQTDQGAWCVALPSAESRKQIAGIDIIVPGDFSSASFFLVAASIVPDSDVLIENVGMNQTRVGLLALLQRMGAQIEICNPRETGGESVADLRVQGAPLNAISVDHRDVVLAIDEIPIFSVAAAFASGTTTITGAEELRVKESDRLTMTVKVLQAFGVSVEEQQDGLTIVGAPERAASPTALGEIKRSWQGSGDHRIAMTAAIIEHALTRQFTLVDVDHVETSFPTFVSCFQSLS